MEYIITGMAAFIVFALFFAVFFLKPHKGDEPITVHTCAREKCRCDTPSGGVQILERMSEGAPSKTTCQK